MGKVVLILCLFVSIGLFSNFRWVPMPVVSPMVLKDSTIVDFPDSLFEFPKEHYRIKCLIELDSNNKFVKTFFIDVEIEHPKEYLYYKNLDSNKLSQNQAKFTKYIIDNEILENLLINKKGISVVKDCFEYYVGYKKSYVDSLKKDFQYYFEL